ncbi:hypothetical protein [Anthocerotibacter panamensis]|uniref:hypothetical protein n=1 Tax=Anthocerotibacter panamensis TaxID=2857077 RepID=UPI001C4025BB|nr:hypothetical protein [Anthocerotibacter panamensis]
MKKNLLVLLLTTACLGCPVLAQGREDVPIYDAWAGIDVPPLEYSENVIRKRQDRFVKGFVQRFEDTYIQPSLRTRDLPTPFNGSLRAELGYFETTQNLQEVSP